MSVCMHVCVCACVCVRACVCAYVRVSALSCLHQPDSMAEDLYKLLVVESGLPPPYVLVGVELGALISRFFAQIFEG